MNPAAADTAFAAFLLVAAIGAFIEYWQHLRKMDDRTGRRRKEREDAAIRRNLQRRGEHRPRWRP